MSDKNEKRYSRKREQRKIKFDILTAFAQKREVIYFVPHREHSDSLCLLTLDEIKKLSKFSAEDYENKQKLKELKNAIINSYEKSETFYNVLMKFKKKKGIQKDTELYKRARVSRKTFHLIKRNDFYCPSKQTIMAFVVALRLNEDETRELFSSAGVTFCSSRADDTFYDYLIRSGILKRQEVDVIFVNELLNELQLPLLGSVMKEEKIKKKPQVKHNSLGARIKR